jgi:redox-sensitive bicupin YhaK (pirin superfamily)
MTAASAASLLVRPADQRFHSQLDWLDSWHSFSFAGHHDPAWMGFGPLRVINDDTIAPGRGFGMHPHRDMEIVTVMLEGQLQHRDSMGHAAVLRAGEVQRMSAGRGVVHSEINRGDQSCRLLQIWIEPRQPGGAPAYEQKAFPLEPAADGWTLLLDPAGCDGAMAIQRTVRLWRARPRPAAVLPMPLAQGRRGWLQMIEGALVLPAPAEAPHGWMGPGCLQRGDGLGFSAGALRSLQAGPDGADLLVFEFD